MSVRFRHEDKETNMSQIEFGSDEAAAIVVKDKLALQNEGRIGEIVQQLKELAEEIDDYSAEAEHANLQASALIHMRGGLQMELDKLKGET